MASAAFQVNGAGRDFKFQITDSCNCSCSSKKKKDPTQIPVFVKEDGTVVKFSKKKANGKSQEAIHRSLSNLEAVVKDLAKAHFQNHEAVLREIPIDKSKPRPLTLEEVQRLQDMIKTPRSGSPVSPTSEEKMFMV